MCSSRMDLAQRAQHYGGHQAAVPIHSCIHAAGWRGSSQRTRSGARGGPLSAQRPASRALPGGRAGKQRPAWAPPAMPPMSL